MHGFKRRVGLAAAVVTATLVSAPAALGQTAPVLEGGKTAPVFGYADAIRERVFIESPYDSDKNGSRTSSRSTSSGRRRPTRA